LEINHLVLTPQAQKDIRAPFECLTAWLGGLDPADLLLLLLRTQRFA